MHRSGIVKSASGTLLLITAVYFVSAACGQATAPCAKDPSKQEARGLLDGRWRATTINGQPALGWRLPSPRTETFFSGIIEFQTLTTEGDNCDTIFRSKGDAVAIYALRDANGNLPAGSSRYVSKFTYFHDAKTISFTAGEQTVTGTVSGLTMTLVAPQFGSATMVLTRF